MDTKKFMVFFLAILAIASVAVVVSAGEIADDYAVEVDGMFVNFGIHQENYINVIAGEDATIDVYFTAVQDDSDVTIEIELEGEKVETRVVSEGFDVENGSRYHKKLSIEVPYELKDQTSDFVTLDIEIDGRDHKTVLPTVTLKVQRPSYNAVIKSLTVPSSINAGDSFAVDFVLKNMGYNELEDLYVEVAIPELSISQGPMWIGDLVELENCNGNCDEEDTVAGRLYLDVPYGTEEGIYELSFTVYNDDVEATMYKQIVVNNDYSEEVIVMDSDALISVGENAEFSILLVNPTDNVKVYTIVAEDVEGLSITSEPTIVAVSAGSSKTVTLSVGAQEEGLYDFSVNIFAGESIVDTLNFNVEVEGKTSSTTVILTIILAIIFLVLLVILIVLIGRKPEKTEDLGESYY